MHVVYRKEDRDFNILRPNIFVNRIKKFSFKNTIGHTALRPYIEVFGLVCILYCSCFNLCNVWGCVGVGFVMCGGVQVWVCVGVGFVMCGCV